MGKREKPAAPSHQMKICVAGKTYVVESRPLGAAHEQRRYAYRVWCDGALVKDWTEGNMADFFGMLPEAGKE
jgi:hypothetical protein